MDDSFLDDDEGRGAFSICPPRLCLATEASILKRKTLMKLKVNNKYIFLTNPRRSWDTSQLEILYYFLSWDNKY